MFSVKVKMIGFIVVLTWGCEENLVNFAMDDSSQEAQIEKAKVLMDERKYSDAVEILASLQNDEATDSNDVRILHAAAKLGAASLDVWSIISRILEGQTNSSGGLDSIFTSISDTVLGTGEEKETRLTSLAESITLLAAAPDREDERAINVACVLAGILTIPLGSDFETIVTGLNPALEEVQSGVSTGSCDTTPLNTTFTAIDSALTTLNLVIGLIPQCSIFNLQSGSSENAVETLINKLSSNADKGCQTPTCPADIAGCDDLFSSCVTNVVGTGETTANGSIERCELVLHCHQPSLCF